MRKFENRSIYTGSQKIALSFKLERLKDTKMFKYMNSILKNYINTKVKEKEHRISSFVNPF